MFRKRGEDPSGIPPRASPPTARVKIKRKAGLDQMAFRPTSANRADVALEERQSNERECPWGLDLCIPSRIHEAFTAIGTHDPETGIVDMNESIFSLFRGKSATRPV